MSIAAISKGLCFPGNIYNNNLELTGSHGTLESPEKDSVYLSHMSCNWLITVPDGKTVKLSFDIFELLTWSATCTADYVEILYGKNGILSEKGKFCGYTIPEEIHSSGRYMLVRFRSGQIRTNYKGFKATFTAEDKPSKSEIL